MTPFRRPAPALAPAPVPAPTPGLVAPPQGMAARLLAAAEAGPVVLLGGAGTGRTAALQELSVLVARQAGPDQVVGVAADRAAARAWQAAAARGTDAVAPLITTVTGLAQQLLTGAGTAPEDPDLRLLTAPEQELRIRELLAGTVTSGSVEWPAEWKPALGTRTFARHLRRAVAHARRWGWEPDDLCAAAAAAGDPGWLAVGQFLAEYLQVLDWEGALDYAEVALRALRRCESGALPRPFGSRCWLLVDDAQFLDPTQARLLRAVAAEGRLVVTADPDQSVGSYRGADLAALRLLAADASIVVADTCHRGGAALRDARARLLGSRWYRGLDVRHAAAFRTPAVTGAEGQVEALVFDDAQTQARHLATLLHGERRAGRAWRDLAVLMTRPGTELATLARILADAGIPLHVPATDRALAEVPAVAALLRAGRLVLADDAAAAEHDDDWLLLLGSDCAGSVPARSLRALRREATRSHPVPDAGWATLAADPQWLAGLPADLQPAASALLAVGGVIDRARALHRRDRPPAEVLWQVWGGNAEAWPRRLRRRALGSGAGAVAANRDLDAVIELFRLAERAPQRWGGTRGLAALLDEVEHQEIPAEPDLSVESGADAVALWSLYRAAGRSWPVVVVTGLVESAWSGEESGGLIQPGRLGADALLPTPPRRAAAERRRLLTLALGRAQERLVLCADGGTEDPPTALLDDAGVSVRRVTGPPPQPATPLDLFLGARRAAARALTPTDAAPAVAALARLASARDSAGDLLFAGMDPRRWPGVAEWTVAPVPLRDPERPLSVSGSALAALSSCQFRWLMQRELAGDRSDGTAAGFGLAVHAAAAALVTGDPSRAHELLDEWWPRFDAEWQDRLHRAEAETAVARAAQWVAARPGELHAEQRLDVRLPVTDESGRVVDQVRVTGSVDLVETSDEHLLVWDYKTRRSAAAGADVAVDVQLAVYQWALAETLGVPARGAGLVHLCVPAGAREPDLPKVRAQGPADEHADWAGGVLRRAVAAVRAEQFTATPGPGCRTCPVTALCPAAAGGPA